MTEDIVEKKLYLIALYDYYGELLTKKQSMYFEGYYFDDMSITEMALSCDVSRNAVHDQLKKIISILEKYENVLNLYKNNRRRTMLIEDIQNEVLSDVVRKLVNELEKVE